MLFADSLHAPFELGNEGRPTLGQRCRAAFGGGAVSAADQLRSRRSSAWTPARLRRRRNLLWAVRGFVVCLRVVRDAGPKDRRAGRACRGYKQEPIGIENVGEHNPAAEQRAGRRVEPSTRKPVPLLQHDTYSGYRRYDSTSRLVEPEPNNDSTG
jgi:hypothetical protein